MNNVSKPFTSELLSNAPAANDDKLDEAMQTATITMSETASGWDAHDVWRRFIKEARERRLLEHPPG